MSKSIICECLKCGKEHRMDAWDNVLGNMRCGCGGILALKDKQTSAKTKGITVDVNVNVEFKGYDKAKQQLRNLEATLDRIIDKQKQIGNSPTSISNDDNNYELLIRIDNSCAKIVKALEPKKCKVIDVMLDGKIVAATVDNYGCYNR